MKRDSGGIDGTRLSTDKSPGPHQAVGGRENCLELRGPRR
jgi:hypothetical protein